MNSAAKSASETFVCAIEVISRLSREEIGGNDSNVEVYVGRRAPICTPFRSYDMNECTGNCNSANTHSDVHDKSISRSRSNDITVHLMTAT